MKTHRILLSPSQFSDDFKEQERKRATKALAEADSFVVITKKGGHNDCVSALEHDHTKIMAFNCHLAEQGILESIKESEELDNGEKE